MRAFALVLLSLAAGGVWTQESSVRPGINRLYKHPDVREAAAIALTDADGGVRIVGYVAWQGRTRPSVLALKAFSASALPAYMVPDVFVFRDELPRTSTDKIDYQRLALEARA